MNINFSLSSKDHSDLFDSSQDSKSLSSLDNSSRKSIDKRIEKSAKIIIPSFPSGKKSNSDPEFALLTPTSAENVMSKSQQELLAKFNKLEAILDKFQELIKNGKDYTIQNNLKGIEETILHLQDNYNSEGNLIQQIHENVFFNINSNDRDKYLTFSFLKEERPYIGINYYLNKLTLKVKVKISTPQQVITHKNLAIMKSILGEKVVENIFQSSDQTLKKKKESELTKEEQLDIYGKAIQLLNAMHGALKECCRILKSKDIPWEKAKKNKSAFLKEMNPLPVTSDCKKVMIKIAKVLSDSKKDHTESLDQMMNRVADAFQKYLDFLDSSIEELIIAQVNILEDQQRERNITPSFNYHNYLEAVKKNIPLPGEFPSTIFTDYQRVIMGGYVYYIDEQERYLIGNFLTFKKNLKDLIDCIKFHQTLPKQLPLEYQWNAYSNFVSLLLKRTKELNSPMPDLKQQIINLYIACNMECAGNMLFNDSTLFADLTTELYQWGAISTSKKDLENTERNELQVHADNFEELVKLFNEEKKDPKKKEQNNQTLTSIMEQLQEKGHKITSLADLRKKIFYVLLFYSAPNQDLLLNDTKILAQLYQTAFNEKLQSVRTLNWSDTNTKNISFIFEPSERFGCRLMRRSPLIGDAETNKAICYLIKKMEIYVPDPSKVEDDESLNVDVSIQYFYEVPHEMSDENQKKLDNEIRRLNLICDAAGYSRIQPTNYKLDTREEI